MSKLGIMLFTLMSLGALSLLSPRQSGMQDTLDSRVPFTGLGWYDYEESHWSEVGDQIGREYVVQLGMNKRLLCDTGHVCYVASHVMRLSDDHHYLCPAEVDKFGIKSQYSVGAATGVMVQWGEGNVALITAQHVETIIGGSVLFAEDVLFGHDAHNAALWLSPQEDTLKVPAAYVRQIKAGDARKANDDLMALRLVEMSGNEVGGGSRGAALGQVQEGDVLHAFIHAFGLPMKVVDDVKVSKCEADGSYCYAELDFAVGGSGGPLFTNDGKLAGVLTGTTHWLQCKHGEDNAVDPCGVHKPGCDDQEGMFGQKFVPVNRIAKLLQEEM